MLSHKLLIPRMLNSFIIDAVVCIDLLTQRYLCDSASDLNLATWDDVMLCQIWAKQK